MSEHKLSKLQQGEFAVFKEFLKICEEHNFNYYIVAGTLLGAVRHKGFIPWDDDIDIAMPRPDFERFIELVPSLLPENLYLSTFKNDPDHIVLVTQIFDKNKIYTLNNASKQTITGAWIDILVLDGAPDPGIKRTIFSIKYMYYRMMCQFAHFDEIVDVVRTDRPWYEKLAIKFAQLTKIQKHLDGIKLGTKFDNLLKTYPYETSKEIATFLSRLKLKEMMPREWYGKGALYEFEGLMVKGPDMYDEWLTYYYGDYMTPPPLEDRDRHGVREE